MFKLYTILTSFIVISFLFVSPAQAAPSASVKLTSDQRYVLLDFSDLRQIAKVSYTLTYTTSSRSSLQGFSGGFKVTPKTTRTTRKQILGTCSSGHCVFHRQPKNILLEVAFTSRSGQTTTITKSLRD
jgi:hypothetical protein